MHILAASGGAGPHQITGFLFALQDEDITLKALDDFQTQVRKGSQRLLRRGFFQQRPVRERHSAFKCFAAECVAAVDVLVMFFTMCLFPRGLLLQHGMCTQLLESIMDIAFCGDRALQHVDKLDLLARGHQVYSWNSMELYLLYQRTITYSISPKVFADLEHL